MRKLGERGKEQLTRQRQGAGREVGVDFALDARVGGKEVALVGAAIVGSEARVADEATLTGGGEVKLHGEVEHFVVDGGGLNAALGAQGLGTPRLNEGSEAVTAPVKAFSATAPRQFEERRTAIYIAATLLEGGKALHLPHELRTAGKGIEQGGDGVTRGELAQGFYLPGGGQKGFIYTALQQAVAQGEVPTPGDDAVAVGGGKLVPGEQGDVLSGERLQSGWQRGDGGGARHEQGASGRGIPEGQQGEVVHQLDDGFGRQVVGAVMRQGLVGIGVEKMYCQFYFCFYIFRLQTIWVAVYGGHTMACPYKLTTTLTH